MILLVRLDPPPHPTARLVCRDDLPAEGLEALLAAAVRCATDAEADAALRWRAGRSAPGRPLPVALVVPRDPEIARRIALEAVAPAALLFEDELLEGSRLPARVLEVLWSAGALGAVEEEALRDWGATIDEVERETLRRLVRAGIAGRRVQGAAQEVGMSAATLARWTERRGMPAPGTLLRDARTRALRHLLAAGVEPAEAARHCGWSGAQRAKEFLRRGAWAQGDV